MHVQVHVCLETGHVYLIFVEHCLPSVDKRNTRYVFGLNKADIGCIF